MNKQVLSPFDYDLCAMVEDLTGKKIEVTPTKDNFVLSWDQPNTGRVPEEQRNEAIKQAVNGRLGTRVVKWEYKDGRQNVFVEYDPTDYPLEVRTRLTAPDATAGQKYCRILLEIDAIQVRRDNLDDLIRFTGGGTMTIPRSLDGVAIYSFPDNNGIFIDAPEKSYIILNPNGQYSIKGGTDFYHEFEEKEIRNVGSYDGAPAKPSLTEIAYFFNDLFGTNIASRCRKMEEEFNEYKEAVTDAMPTFDDQDLMNAVIDELADLNVIIFHTAAILGISQMDLLGMAYDKVKGRLTDPNYKRASKKV